MDLHVVQLEGDALGFVVGCCVLIQPDEESQRQINALPPDHWLWNGAGPEVADRFED